MTGIIYRITNILNGKNYIGQTVQSLKERWYQHCQKKGFSLRNLAKEYNVDKATIKSALIRNNVYHNRTKSYKLSQKDRQDIISKINAGASRKTIIKEYSISKSYLSQLITGSRRI